MLNWMWTRMLWPVCSSPIKNHTKQYFFFCLALFCGFCTFFHFKCMVRCVLPYLIHMVSCKYQFDGSFIFFYFCYWPDLQCNIVMYSINAPPRTLTYQNKQRRRKQRNKQINAATHTHTPVHTSIQRKN